jgi:hypothetical protein
LFPVVFGIVRIDDFESKERIDCDNLSLQSKIAAVDALLVGSVAKSQGMS